MGASTFMTRARGATASEAFDNATAEARYEYGHGGYTGTIAEKHSFTMISLPAGQQADRFADKLLSDDDDRVCDKWGPAGCIKVEDGEFLFFGWASC